MSKTEKGTNPRGRVYSLKVDGEFSVSIQSGHVQPTINPAKLTTDDEGASRSEKPCLFLRGF